jgi:GAF domain-containing protein
MSAMDARATSLEEFLAAVLRGAAKIIGCASTNLVLINEKTQEIRIRLGTLAVANPVVSEIEQVLGNSLHEICVPIRGAEKALAFRAWRERAILETSSLAELVGTAFGPGVVEQLAPLVGDLRFICVPALSHSRCYGVLLFQKEGKHPFTRQQREVILRYARRIGAILEADLTGQGQLLFSRMRGGPDYLLFDRTGQLRG